jgi:predicted nucleotidyltransferase
MTQQTIINYLLQHKEEFQKEYAIDKIGLFGSYARNEAKENSDIDIVVSMQPSFSKLMGLKLQIEEELKQKVDIVRLREQMNQYLKNRIQKDVIYV